MSKDIDKDLLGVFRILTNLFVEYAGRDFLWYNYEEKGTKEICTICNIALVNGDRCRPLECEHKFHIECIVRYSDRVENCCPICKLQVLPLLASLDETRDFLEKNPTYLNKNFF